MVCVEMTVFLCLICFFYLWKIARFLRCVFPFYVEIQDGRQNDGKTIFREKMPDDSVDNLGVKNFRRNRSISHGFRDKCVFTFYVEIQENAGKTNFWENHQMTLLLP